MENVVEISRFLASSLHSSLGEIHLSPINCINHPLQSTHDDHPQRKPKISLAAQPQRARPPASHRAVLIPLSMTGRDYPGNGWLNKLTQLLAKELQMKGSSFPTLSQCASSSDRSANFNQCCSSDRDRHHCNYFQDVDSHTVGSFHHNETISVKINRKTETMCLQLHNLHVQPLCPSQIWEMWHYSTPKLIHTDYKPENNEDPHNIAHFAFLLLLLAGDVEVNPGPGK